MTGEITLRGEVLPIGGLKEKLLAAHRGGIKTVLIPEQNVKDLAEIPDNVKNKLEIVPVRWIDKVLEIALERQPAPIVEVAGRGGGGAGGGRQGRAEVGEALNRGSIVRKAPCGARFFNYRGHSLRMQMLILTEAIPPCLIRACGFFAARRITRCVRTNRGETSEQD